VRELNDSGLLPQTPGHSEVHDAWNSEMESALGDVLDVAVAPDCRGDRSDRSSASTLSPKLRREDATTGSLDGHSRTDAPASAELAAEPVDHLKKETDGIPL
jgi:hypothetical protein